MLKFTNERLWLCIAVAGLLLTFERHSVLEVKSGEVIASDVSFWFYKREIKKINVSDVGEISCRSKYIGRTGWTPSLLVNTKSGGLFCKINYHNAFTCDQRSESDKEKLKEALALGMGFRTTQNESFYWIALVFVSLFVYVYKRALRLERERKTRTDTSPEPKDSPIKFSSSKVFRYKLRKVKGNVGDKRK